MKTKLFFLVFHGFSEYNGISKKILAQINGFIENDIDVTLCHYDVEENGSRVWKVNNVVLADYGKGLWAKIRKRMDYRQIIKYLVRNRVSYVYIRSDHNANPFTIHLVKNIRRLGIKVLMEIPTFPYDQEYDTCKMKLELAVDKLFRRQLAKQLNAWVTFTDVKCIFGQQTIRISNGIDFNSIPLRQPVRKESQDLTVNLIAVAEIHYWHGFDRLISGLAIYNRNRPLRRVIFHLVGELRGDREKREILGAIEREGLQQDVVVHGALWGSKLDNLFDLADFAIGSLGRHRAGISSIRTLKNREYAARGIPFIYAEIDPDFEDRQYIIKAKADDSPIDINEILDFLVNNNCSPAAIRESIKQLSWTGQIHKMLHSKILISS